MHHFYCCQPIAKHANQRQLNPNTDKTILLPQQTLELKFAEPFLSA
jgi:hypothetical protein